MIVSFAFGSKDECLIASRRLHLVSFRMDGAREYQHALHAEHRCRDRAAVIATVHGHRGLHQIRFLVVANPVGSGAYKS